MKTKLGIIATHPIQYQVPWYRGLVASGEVELKVYFALLPDAGQQGLGFGKAFQWDVPLVDGYAWECLPSAKKRPSLHGFFGNSTPGLGAIFKRDGIQQMIITGWNAYPLLQAVAACALHGIPLIVRGESNAMRSRNLKARSLHRILLPWFDVYLAIGESSAEFYRGYGVKEERIFYARYFVDNDRFARQAACERPLRAQYRREWGISEEATCFVYVGKLEPKKRILDVLEALRLCQVCGVQIHVLVVGSGELEARAREKALREHLPVTFAGFLNQTELSRAYVAADAMVLPSDYGETWGLVVNEAMVSGLPVIISDRVGCGPDLVYGKGTGAVFPFGDTEALSQAMFKMTTEAGARAKAGARASELIQAYCPETAVKGTLEAVKYLTSIKAAIK